MVESGSEPKSEAQAFSLAMPWIRSGLVQSFLRGAQNAFGKLHFIVVPL